MPGKNHFYSVTINQETDQTRWNHFKRLTSSFKKEIKSFWFFLRFLFNYLIYRERAGARVGAEVPAEQGARGAPFQDSEIMT